MLGGEELGDTGGGEQDSNAQQSIRSAESERCPEHVACLAGSYLRGTLAGRGHPRGLRQDPGAKSGGSSSLRVSGLGHQEGQSLAHPRPPHWPKGCVSSPPGASIPRSLLLTHLGKDGDWSVLLSKNSVILAQREVLTKNITIKKA